MGGWHHRLNGYAQGNRLSCRDQEGRRGSEEAVPGPSVFPSVGFSRQEHWSKVPDTRLGEVSSALQ